jgi:GTP-binding protein Era
MDVVLFVVEPAASIGPGDTWIMERLKHVDSSVVLVINKIDTIRVEESLPIIELYSQRHGFNAIIPISAKKGDGVPQLLEVFNSFSAGGQQLFPDGMVTDQPEKQIIAEIIREKLLLCMQREIPHGTAVEITKFSERDSGRGDDGIIDVDATIYCEKASHKGMIIGKNGAMLKKIGELARVDIEYFMGAKVFLQTWVKVKENWRDSKTSVRNFGYGG